MKIFNLRSLAIIAGSLVAFSAAAVPNEITFTNNTSLSLSTSIAGLPGNGISANETKAVGYGIVTMGCNFGNALTNCPIVFTDRATGEKVASVNIDASTASLVQPPVFYGNYESNYEVTGWENGPISHISINLKA